MREYVLSLCVGAALVTGLGVVWPVTAQTGLSSRTGVETQTPARAACPTIANAQAYDVIVFGDEVPGVMTAMSVKRELRESGLNARVALVTEGDSRKGLGGHLVRGGLAYLDRNQVPPALRSQYGTFGMPSRLYQEFLGLGQVNTIALDRFAASQNMASALQNSGVDLIDKVSLGPVQTSGSLVCAFTASGKTYTARQFIDSSQSGELAAASGVEMMKGLEALVRCQYRSVRQYGTRADLPIL
jgi:hypothetical protein